MREGWTVRWFSSFEEAEAHDRADRRQRSSTERLALAIHIVFGRYDPEPDFRPELERLLLDGTPFLVVGAYAGIRHGVSRYTDNLDVWMPGLVADHSRGASPGRLDLHRSQSGLDFRECWERAEKDELLGLPLRFLSKADFMLNKASPENPSMQFDRLMIEDLDRPD